MGWCAVGGVQGVEHWAQHAALRCAGAQGHGGGDVGAKSDALRAVSEKVLDPGRDGGNPEVYGSGRPGQSC